MLKPAKHNRHERENVNVAAGFSLRKLIQDFLIIFFFFCSVFCTTSEGKTMEDLDPEYCISKVQSNFLPWWEDEWEETVTGFRIMGSSFNLPTLHVLQHWKGTFPLNEHLSFSLDYFTDAGADSQFYKKEMELKCRFKGRNYIFLFGYPYYDKKESDVGIGYSFEETPLDFIRFSILFENTPNNYMFKDRNKDSMRIYKKIPLLYSIEISVIKKEKNRLILSYNIGPLHSASYENKDGEILFRTEGEKSDISVKHRYYSADSSEWGWNISFLYNKKNYCSSGGGIDSSFEYARIIQYIYLNKKIKPLYNLLLQFNRDLEEKTISTGINRRAILLGIIRNFSTHSKVGLLYCNGKTNHISMEKIRKDNRLILIAEHRLRNKARLGFKLGIELDTRDTTHGHLGRYDKIFFFFQYPIK